MLRFSYCVCFQVLSTSSSGWIQAKSPQFSMLLKNHLKIKALLKEQSTPLCANSKTKMSALQITSVAIL